MTARRYCAVSFTLVAIYDKAEDLFGALYYWQEPYCEMYVVETLEEAHIIATQRYAALFYGHPNHFGIQPMDLPATGYFAVRAPKESMIPMHLQQASVPMLTAPSGYALQGGQSVSYQTWEQNQQPELMTQGGPLVGGAWSVVHLDGYMVLGELNSLIGEISSPDCVYPHAKWWWHPEHATFWAQMEYADRFSRCFDIRDTYPAMPNRPVGVGEQFKSTYTDFKPSDSFAFNKLKNIGIL